MKLKIYLALSNAFHDNEKILSFLLILNKNNKKNSHVNFLSTTCVENTHTKNMLL